MKNSQKDGLKTEVGRIKNAWSEASSTLLKEKLEMVGVLKAIREKMELTEKKGWDDIDVDNSESHQEMKKAKMELIGFLRDLDAAMRRVLMQAKHQQQLEDGTLEEFKLPTSDSTGQKIITTNVNDELRVKKKDQIRKEIDVQDSNTLNCYGQIELYQRHEQTVKDQLREYNEGIELKEMAIKT